MTSNVIFIHPDGADPSHFAAARLESVGPDGRLHWDEAPRAGVYLGHLDDQVVATSNAGAVVHAYGIKAVAPSYGFDENGAQYQSLAALQGKNVEGSASDATILEEAIAAGRPTAVINSGFIAEPGTGVFLADAESRSDRQGITAQVVESGVNVIMAAGEIDYLPVGTVGFFGEEGTRTDSRNLIEEAEDLGYTVVYTREQLNSLPADTERVLGIFAAEDTYNDVPERALVENGFVDENGELITYGQPPTNPNPPTVAEMLDATLKLNRFSQEKDGFLIVLEEEGTDNFANNNNARGTIDATLRADAAIGVARDFIANVNSNTFVITAADSAGGGLEIDDVEGPTVGTLTTQPQLDAAGNDSGVTVPLDGTTGSNTAPFVSAPDANGNSFEFGVAWAGLPDFAGSIVSKAYGEGAERLPATLDNTTIYRLMYESLFDVSLDAPEGVPDDLAPRQAPEPTSDKGNVIFIHPDGTSPSHYAAARFSSLGTDGRLNWDQMSNAGVYLGHIEDRLVSTSNAGAVVHAYGVKPFAGSYGFNAPLDEGGEEVVALSGQSDTIMQEAQAAGKAIGIINSGFIAEPGTGVFLADVDNRNDTEEITSEILDQRPDVILGAGETDYLPVGTIGVFGEEGTRTDGRNLIEEAKAAGYTVVFTRDELLEIDTTTTDRLLGIFAAEDTYNDFSEDELRRDGLVDENEDLILYGQPPLNPNPPSVAEMLEVALPILDRDPDGFFVVLEEEGTDNFGNDNNAAGTIEAAIRADEAIGVALDFVDNTDPNTLVITAADSDAGGLEVADVPVSGFGLDPDLTESGFTIRTQAELAAFGDSADGTLVQLDDKDGSNDVPGFSTDVFDPFVTGAPDADGDIFEFGVAWATRSDVNGGIVAKSYGLNADLLPATTDNTDIYRVMYQTLFGNVPGQPRTELVGFASLPADTFADGPTSGNDNGNGEPIDANGRTGPFEGQPVQGFSGVQFADADGSFWFLSDNGFGAQTNSADYLLRLYKVDPSFVGSEGGDGSVEIEDFIQLSDPNNLIPFDIQNENSAERLLTGADFDIESFVIDSNGEIWIGDEFGPFLLHFDATGELIDAPIATPNLTNFNTLNGQDPIVIGHRGASGILPEHTLEAYKVAIAQGADFIEPDLVITKDGVLIARHEPILDDTTNVAEVFGPERMSTKNLDGTEVTAYFAEDFTLAEIKQLRAVQSRDFRPQDFNNAFEIPTFQEVIELVQKTEAETGVKVGIYPETKHPTFFDLQGLSLEEPLIATLEDTGFTDPSRIFIQSFEFQNLIELQGLLDAKSLGEIPLVQLYGDTTASADPASSFSFPYDIRYNLEQGNDLAAIYGQEFLDAVENGISENTTYRDLDSAEFLEIISSIYAEGAGPWKNNFILRETLETPVDGNGDGLAEITTQLTGEITSFVDDAHDAGLQVHPYTLRNEERFLTLDADGNPQTPEAEFQQLVEIGVDGFFTDFPGTGVAVVDSLAAGVVRSPQNPELGGLIPNLPASRGFEGMAISPDRQTLYPLLEGTVNGDPTGALRIYEFDVASKSFANDILGFYQLDDLSHAIGDFTVINADEYLVIERDGKQGDEAAFKKIFKVNLSEVDENGFVAKEELVDLLDISDPNDFNGDGSTEFKFPFVTIEDVLVLDEQTLLVANDNNYPFSVGRGPDIDNNEIIQIKLEAPLAVDPLIFPDAVSDNPLPPAPDDAIAGTDAADSLRGDSSNNYLIAFEGDDFIQGRFGNDTIDGGTGNDLIQGNRGNDLIAGFGGHDTLIGGMGDDTLFGGIDDDDLKAGTGDDRLYGGDGDDRLFGNQGNDTIIGGIGDDRLRGQQGNDVFVLAADSGLDQVLDFRIGQDVMGLSDGLTFADLSFSDSDIGVDILAGGSLIATIQRLSAAVFGVESNFTLF